MKKRINTIKNKILVEGGGENLLKDNEILVQNSNGKISLKERTATGVKEIVGSGSDSDEEDCYYIRTYTPPDYEGYAHLWTERIIESNIAKSCILILYDDGKGALCKSGFIVAGSGFTGCFCPNGISYVAVKKQVDLYYTPNLEVPDFVKVSMDFKEWANMFCVTDGDISLFLISKEEYYSHAVMSFEDFPEGKWPPE